MDQRDTLPRIPNGGKIEVVWLFAENATPNLRGYMLCWRTDRIAQKKRSTLTAMPLAAGLFVAVLLGFVCSRVNLAHASGGYACYDKPCSDERKEYVKRWEGRVCAYSRALKNLLRRKARGQRTRDEVLDRLNRCLARHARRPALCSHHARRLRAINQTLSEIQRRLNRLVARLQASCDVSLPNGVAGNPPTCEEQEASKYCPIADEAQADRSMEQRCADLRDEKAAQAVCKACRDPGQPIAAASGSKGWGDQLAGARPTCAPRATFTPVGLVTPLSTNSPES